MQNQRGEIAADEENNDVDEKQTPEADDIAQSAEMAGKTSHDTQQVQQVEQAKDAAGRSDDQQQEVSQPLSVALDESAAVCGWKLGNRGCVQSYSI